MVLWLKKHRRITSLLYALILAFLFCIPYLFRDLLPIGHDTFFHVSRIDGLAASIKDGDFLPAIYPYKNSGFGYGSPLFYCDVMLYPFALLDVIGVPVSICYKLVIFVWTMLTAYTMSLCAERITHSFQAGTIAAAAVLFANYRITDVYVRGALGETQAFIFLPVLIEGLYIILYEKKTEQWQLAAFGLAALLMSHNLTFVLSCFLTMLLITGSSQKLNPETIPACIKAIVAAFLLTVFFSLPMLEQLQSNRYYLNYYAETSDLSSGTLPLWKYFANQTVFGYSDNSLERNQQMLLNPGWFLTIAPLLWLYVRKKKPNAYLTLCLILGYVNLILPSSVIPWQSLDNLKVMQFPWRLLESAVVLLAIPASAAIAFLFNQPEKIFTALILVCLCAEGIYHIYPVFHETFGMTSSMSWEDVTNGALCDPAYSATYMRVELAGGDYLPITSPDYRRLFPVIMDENYKSLSTPYEKNGTRITFTLDEKNTDQTVVLPLTWYKGYTLYHMENGRWVKMSCHQDDHGLVSFYAKSNGKYKCVYLNTPLRNICIVISLVSWCFFLLSLLKRTRIKV